MYNLYREDSEMLIEGFKDIYIESLTESKTRKIERHSWVYSLVYFHRIHMSQRWVPERVGFNIFLATFFWVSYWTNFLQWLIYLLYEET